MGWTGIYQPDQEKKWKITGPGAIMQGGLRVSNPLEFPFVMEEKVNDGLIEYLRQLLCRHKGLRTDAQKKRPAEQTKSVQSNFSSLPGASGYTILDFGLVSSDRGIISGLASINSPKHCVDKYPWRAINRGEGKWEITGLGALLEGGVRADNSAYPFSMDPQLNAGLTEALTQWLNKNHSDSPVAEVEEKPQPAKPEAPAKPNQVETKGSTMPPPSKTIPEIQRIFEAVYKVLETDEDTVLNGTERKDSRARRIIALLMSEMADGKTQSQRAEYLKLDVKQFYGNVYMAKKSLSEEPDFRADYLAVTKELGLDGVPSSTDEPKPTASTAGKSRRNVGKKHRAVQVQQHETLISSEDLVLILWKAMGMEADDVAQMMGITPEEVKQNIGAIVLSSANGADPIKERFKQIGEKILQLADS